MPRGRKRDKKREKLNLKKLVLEVVETASGRGFNYKEIAGRLNISDTTGRNTVIRILHELKAKGTIKEVERGRYLTVLGTDLYEGIIHVNLQGNGYVSLPDFEKDVFIPYSKLNSAFNGDRVSITVSTKPRSGVLEGRVKQILERKRTKFVGTVDKFNEFGFVKPRDPKIYKDFYVSSNNLGQAKDGDSVLVELIGWTDKGNSPEAKVLEIFGRPGDHDTEIHAILGEYGLPYDFDSVIQNEADALSLVITDEEIGSRRDYREVLTFTIDPKDAKDFDDALSFRKLEDELYEIGVHIADVSHYVKEGTLLDEEAFNRGTSVYLVDRVVPMLPEILSNQACSLRPNEDKLTFSVIFTIRANGKIEDTWFGRTVTHSIKRFSYEEAQWLLETRGLDVSGDISLSGMEYTISTELLEALLSMNNLAKGLREKRMNDGAISFDKIEVKFNLDANSEPTGVYFKEAKDANKLIEEFMLLANRSVAEYIGKVKPSRTFVYRVHDQPDEDKLYALQGIVKRFGYTLDFRSKKALNNSLNDLLEEVKGRGEQNLVDTLAIRSMAKASYTTQNIGHYGLAFDYYTHFTSPIRRYPDIMVHRLLQHYLLNGTAPSADDYELRCKHASDMEILASSAERESIKYMQVRYMESRKNIPFRGVISGVTEWGIYVELLDNKCEGMVRIRDISGDFYSFSQDDYALIGERTGRRFQLGGEVIVEVKHTDILKRHLDFKLVEAGKALRKLKFK